MGEKNGRLANRTRLRDNLTKRRRYEPRNNQAVHWIWTIALNGFLFGGAYEAARAFLPLRSGGERFSAAWVIGWAWAILGMQCLGAIGAIARPSLLAWVVLGAGIGVWASRKRSAARVEPDDEARAGRWDRETVLAVGFTLWTAGELFGVAWTSPVRVVSDGPIYHLYFAAKWWKAGRLFLIPTPFGESAAPYFPADGDLWFTWLFTCWGGERLAKVGQTPFLVLIAATIQATAKRLGANASASALAAAWAVSSTPLLLYAFEPNVDTVVVGLLSASAFFFLLGLDDRPRLAPFCLGAIAAGGAWGTKPTGVVFIPPLLALIALIVVFRRDSDRRRKALFLASLGLGSLLLEAFWLVRNALLTGNPLYPLQVEAFGARLLTGWYGRDAMKRSVYYIPIDDWRSFLGLVFQVFDPRLLPFWIAGLAISLRSVRRSRPRATAAFAVGSILIAALYWSAIPYRTQQRFMLPALAFAAVPLAMLLDRSRFLRAIAAGLTTVHLLTPQSWPLDLWDPHGLRRIAPRIPELPGLLRMPIGDDVLPRIVWVLFGTTAVASAWLWGRKSAGSKPVLGAAPSAIFLVLAFLGGEIVWASHSKIGANDRVFPRFSAYRAAWDFLDQATVDRPARIAYSGTNLPYYLMGSRFQNDVLYVNVDEHSDWLLHDYHRLARDRGAANWPDPRPGWDRLRPNFDAWLNNLRRENVGFLVVAKVNPNEGPHYRNPNDPLGFPIERAWAESRPDLFEPIRGPSENDPQIRIFRLRSRTDRGSKRHLYP